MSVSKLQKQAEKLVEAARQAGREEEAERVTDMLEGMVLYLVEKGLITSRGEIERDVAEAMHYFLWDRQIDLKYGRDV
jgi:hypothetical protein